MAQRRQMVPGSYDGKVLVPPPTYSTDPGSEFYAMAKNVYDKSQTLTAKQTAMALYHRDAPGYPGGGTFIAILSQVIQKAGCSLDVAALGYATWFPLFPTPGHPEFPAAHATSGGVVSAMLTNVFGENFDFTLNHYEYLGLPARSYTSIDELGMEMANNARKLRFYQTPEL